MKKRSGFAVMARLIGLVKPLTGYMLLAILMGLAGHLCASFITIFGGFAVLDLLGLECSTVAYGAVCMRRRVCDSTRNIALWRTVMQPLYRI